MRFSNHVKYLVVIVDKRITWRLHIEIIKYKAFRKRIRIYSLLKSERLSANIKLTVHTDYMSIDLCLTHLGSSGTHRPFILQRLKNKGSPHQWKFSKVHTGPRLWHSFQPSVYIRSYNKIVQAASINHTRSWEWTCPCYRTRQSQTQKESET
jgi:hypothetical protein